jgi:hypothetical protein
MGMLSLNSLFKFNFVNSQKRVNKSDFILKDHYPMTLTLKTNTSIIRN